MLVDIYYRLREVLPLVGLTRYIAENVDDSRCRFLVLERTSYDERNIILNSF